MLCFTEMGSSALLAVVLAGALVSAIHAGKEMIACWKERSLLKLHSGKHTPTLNHINLV